MSRFSRLIALPPDTLVSVEDAASLLRMKLPQLKILLDSRRLASAGLGADRRLMLGDLLVYKARQDARASAARDELAVLGQGLALLS